MHNVAIQGIADSECLACMHLNSVSIPPPPCISYALVQATVGVGTVIIPYIGVAYTRGGGGMYICIYIYLCSKRFAARVVV